jgi:hypothetical protein
VRVGPVNSYGQGGGLYQEAAVFLAHIHHGTNSNDVTAIPATFGGHAPNGKTMSFRLRRTPNADGKSYLEMMVQGENPTANVAIPWRAIRIF